MAESSIERIKKLQSEAATLIGAAKKEAMDKITSALSELKGLGFSYFISEKPAKKRGRLAGSRKGTGKGKIKDAECPICKFKTAPPHDARRHRAQGGKKRPFNAPQLARFGLKKV